MKERSQANLNDAHLSGNASVAIVVVSAAAAAVLNAAAAAAAVALSAALSLLKFMCHLPG